MYYNMSAVKPSEHMATSKVEISKSKNDHFRGIRPISNHPIGLVFAPKSVKAIQKHSNNCN